MKTFFQIITWFFFFFSILVWLFFLRWDVIFSLQAFKIIKMILIPWYLILTWLMVWYLVANIRSRTNSDEERVYSKSFIIWIISWVILALAYMLI